MGADLVCQVIGKPDQVSFIWSAGSSTFDPYHLTGNGLLAFRDLGRQARARLSDLVKDRLHGSDQDVCRSSLELAKVGNKLYQQIFRPAAGIPQAIAGQVRKWLTDMRVRGDVESLEIVMDGLELVPWNIVYEDTPAEREFLSDDASPARWEPFWGIRYNLAGGRRVEPLRRISWLDQPRVLMVIDPKIRAGLPDDQRQTLDAFLIGHGLKTIESRAGLADALKSGRPELMYWLCHADPSALYLGDEAIGANDLLDLLRSGEQGGDRLGGLAFLNACQTAESSEVGSFLDALYEVGLSGVIATEHQTIDTFAGPFGLDFLKAFLDEGQPIGEVLQRLRARGAPMGLLYGTYCPPGLRVLKKAAVGPEVAAAPRIPGAALGPGSAPRPRGEAGPPPPLPDHPYRSLDVYDREHRALFVGRDDDVIRFALVLDDARTRVVLLHGESGVGKSSFLRAGVIPYLEDECVGYRALRSSGGGDSNASLLFVRATGDPVGQIAQALCDACERPYPVSRPDGTSSEVDLPGLLSGLLGGAPATPARLRAAFLEDPALLGRLLSEMAASLPFAPILIVDQAEEVFTLAKSKEDEKARNAVLEMLRLLNTARGGFKVIVSIRTEYLGRMVDRLRLGARDIRGVREYLLTDFNAEFLARAIRHPTSREPIPHAAEPPFTKYRFSYAGTVPEAIAQGLLEMRTTRQDSVLPLLQVICTQLYEQVRVRPEADRVITPRDYDAIGGAQGGMRTHADTLVSVLFRGEAAPDARRFRALMASLTLQQPDGSLSTALVPADERRQSWAGAVTPFDDMLARASGPQVRLLRLATLSFGGQGPRSYVSLGHDALAKVAAIWKKELEREDFDRTRRTKVRWMAAGLAAATAVAALMVILAVVAFRSARRASDNERLAIARKKEADTNAAAALASKTLADQNAAEARTSAELAETRRKEADRSAQLARLEAEKSRKLLARQYLAEGRVRMDRTDYLGALPFLVRSLEVEQTDSGSARLDRERLGAILRSSPRLAQVWPHPAPANDFMAPPAAPGAPAPRAAPGAPAPPAAPGAPMPPGAPVAPASRLHRNERPRSGPGPSTTPVFQIASAASDTPWRRRVILASDPATVHQALETLPALGMLAYQDSPRGFVSAGPTAGVAALQKVTNVAFSRDGRRVITLSTKTYNGELIIGLGTARIWDVDAIAGEPPLVLPEPVGSAEFSPDGALVAAWTPSGEVKFWRSSDLKPVRLKTPIEIPVRAAILMVFSPDGRRLLVADTGGEVRVFAVDDGARLGPPFRAGVESPVVVHAALDREGRRALAVCNDGSVHIWDADAAPPATPTVKLAVGDVIHAAFNREGTLVATGGSDHTLRLWDAATGKPVGEPRQHPGEVLTVGFDGDGRLIAVCPSASRDEELQVHTWDVAAWSEVYPARRFNPDASLTALALSADAHVLLTVEQQADAGNGRLTARPWKIDEGVPVSAPVNLDVTAPAAGIDVVATVLASPLGVDGGSFRVVTVAVDSEYRRALARLFDPKDGRLIAELERFEGPTRSFVPAVQARFSRDGRRLATLLHATEEHLGPAGPPLPPGAQPAPVAPPDPGAQTAASALAGGGTRRSLKVWNAETGTAISKELPHDLFVKDFGFDDRGERLVVWGYHSATAVQVGVGPLKDCALVLDPTTLGAVAPELTLPSSTIALTPGGERLASIDASDAGDRVLRVRSVRTGAETIQPVALGGDVMIGPRMPGEGSPVRILNFTPDGGRVVIAQGDTARSYDLGANGGVVTSYEHGATIERVEVIGDGRRVATIGFDRTIRIWDERGDPAAPPLGVSLPVRLLAMSRDSANVRVVAAQFKALRSLPSAQAPAMTQPSPPGSAGRPPGRAWRATISPDGKFVLLGGPDVVRVWDVARGEQAGPVLKHAGPVWQAAFGPNAVNVATASADGLARIWDLTPMGTPVSPLGAHPDLDPGRSVLGYGPEARRGVGRQLEVMTFDLSPDDRPLAALRGLAELLGTNEIKDVAVNTLDGNRLAALRRSLGESFPDDFRTTEAARRRWLSDQAYECERAAMWSAAADFLTPLIQTNAGGWEAFARRGRALAELAQGDAAAADYGAARRLAPEAAAAWIDREARDCARASLWNSAIVALNDLIVARPADPALLARRGTARASLGDGGRAAAEFAAAAVHDKGVRVAADLAASTFLAGETDRYRDACRAIAARNDLDRADPASAARAARALGLRPDQQSRAPLKRLAHAALMAAPDDRQAQLTWVFALLRNGEADAALAALGRLSDFSLTDINPALFNLLRALALQSAGKAADAARTFRLAQSTPKRVNVNGVAVAPDWLDALLVRTLEDEARHAVKDAPPG